MSTLPAHLPTAQTQRRSTQPLPESVDVALIGAGPSSLTAGARLARQGLSVAIFESHYVAGGCATRFARGPRARRYLFDVGVHYLGAPDKFRSMLDSVDVDVEMVDMDQDGFDTLVFPDLEFRIPVGFEAFRNRMLEHFPSERRGIDRYMRFLREVALLADTLEQTHGRRTFGFFWKVLTQGRLAARYEKATLSQVLDSCTRDPALRAVMAGQHGDYALPPSRVSALLHAGLAVHYLRGAWYPQGGGQILSDRLADRVESEGGTVHLKAPVAGIVVEGGRAVGVRLGGQHEGQTVRAKAVVSGADLASTMLQLLDSEHLSQKQRQRHANWEWPDAIYLTCAAVDDDLVARGMRASNYWQYDGYDIEELYGNMRKGSVPDPLGCYLTSGTVKDPTSRHHAPEGMHTVEIMTLVPGDPASWGVTPEQLADGSYRKQPVYKEAKQRIEQDMMRRFEQLFPGVGQHVVFRESATPLSHSRFTGASNGSGYGIAATPGQFGPKRPGPRSELPGLYLCGASARAGHGIAMAMSGGLDAARVITEDWRP